ncbi:hypothetical protein GCM10008933_23600 [Paenibacillus motobuensis]|uniref:VOC domain-containing protein n=1 Tax=Paenibacillus motobuensis TaxID=295324 RepID=A0ABP3I6G4_9BACL
MLTHGIFLGMGTIEITVRHLNRLANTLTGLFGYVEAYHSDNEAIYQSVAGQSFGEILIKQDLGPREKPGKGSIHHLAIRAKNDEELRYWEAAVKERGFYTSRIVDRFYLK